VARLGAGVARLLRVPGNMTCSGAVAEGRRGEGLQSQTQAEIQGGFKGGKPVDRVGGLAGDVGFRESSRSPVAALSDAQTVHS